MTSTEIHELKEAICRVGHRLYEKGMVAANDGNISVRTDGNEFFCTPTGVSKGSLIPDLILRIDADGNLLDHSALKPSSEIKMHLRVYRERPDVRAVVHAHPPVATAFTVAGIPLDRPILPEAVLTLGAIPTCAYGTPSTEEIPDSLMPFLQDHDAFLLQNHGALTVGETLTRAFFSMEEIEFSAVILKHAMELGKVREIPASDVQKLLAVREKLGIRGKIGKV